MWRTRLFFCALYFIQGTVLAYIVNFQKPFLAGHGVSKETLGFFTGLLLLPFILKVALGAMSDRWPIGRFDSRKPYMLIGLAVFSACYGALSFNDPGQEFAVFAVLAWTASLALALFDTCADGWAVDVSDEKEEGAVQASMVAGKSLGFVTMSLAFGALSERSGFSTVFLVIAAIAMGVFLLVVFTPYRKPSMRSKTEVGSWGDLISAPFLWFGIFGVVYSIASFGTDGLVTLFLNEARGAGNLMVGVYGVGRGLGALTGAVAYAWLEPRFGLRRIQIFALAILGAGCLSPLANVPLWLSGGVWGFCWGFQETAFVTLAMRFSRGRWAATFFAICMIFSNLGTAIGEALGAPLVPRIGYSGVFLSFAVLAWASLIFVKGMTAKSSPAGR